MKKQDFHQIKQRFEKTYPVFIAFTASVLSFFSFFLQFKDLFSAWNVLVIVSLVFLCSVAASWLLTKAFYEFLSKRTANQNRTSYDLIESIDICEFPSNDFSLAKYKRIEKIRLNSNNSTLITYKLPVVNSPGSIENVICKINSREVNYIYQKRYGEDLYGYYLNPTEFNGLVEVAWEFDILNTFSSEDNIRVRSYKILEKLVLRIVFNNYQRKVFAEAYQMYSNEDAAFSKHEIDCKTINSQIIIEKDFSGQLDGGIYRFGIQWKFDGN